jgi:hypothetical protein
MAFCAVYGPMARALAKPGRVQKMSPQGLIQRRTTRLVAI